MRAILSREADAVRIRSSKRAIRVRVATGALLRVEGALIQQAAQSKLVISVEKIQRSVSVNRGFRRGTYLAISGREWQSSCKSPNAEARCMTGQGPFVPPSPRPPRTAIAWPRHTHNYGFGREVNVGVCGSDFLNRMQGWSVPEAKSTPELKVGPCSSLYHVNESESVLTECERGQVRSVPRLPFSTSVPIWRVDHICRYVEILLLCKNSPSRACSSSSSAAAHS